MPQLHVPCGRKEKLPYVQTSWRSPWLVGARPALIFTSDGEIRQIRQIRQIRRKSDISPNVGMLARPKAIAVPRRLLVGWLGVHAPSPGARVQRPPPAARRHRLPPAIAQLHHQDGQRQHQRDGIGHHHRPGLQQPAVGQPQRHPGGEHAVHAQRDAAHVAGAEGQPGLGNKAGGGHAGGGKTDPFGQGHGESCLQRSRAVQSTSASMAGRTAAAWGWLAMATST